MAQYYKLILPVIHNKERRRHSKHPIGLTPLYWRRTPDVGQRQCQEKFFMVGQSVGRRGVRRRRALSDGGRRTADGRKFLPLFRTAHLSRHHLTLIFGKLYMTTNIKGWPVCFKKVGDFEQKQNFTLLHEGNDRRLYSSLPNLSSMFNFM